MEDGDPTLSTEPGIKLASSARTIVMLFPLSTLACLLIQTDLPDTC